MARSVVTVGLMLGCSGARSSEPPAPAPVAVPAPAPSAAPAPAPAAAPAALPAWETVLSPHPAGATNPPRPQLLVTPDGRCFKRWVSPMMPRAASRDQRVAACPGADPMFADCGTEVVCPERAAALPESEG